VTTVRGVLRKQEEYVPWKRKSPTIFDARPKDPTMTTSLGLDISAASDKVRHTVRTLTVTDLGC
jgi:hypothetical protein